MSYNKKLDELFERWTENLSEEQKALFCKDGLMLKAGEPEDSVDEKWDKAKRRIIFIVKDKNTPTEMTFGVGLQKDRTRKTVEIYQAALQGNEDFYPTLHLYSMGY